MSIPYPERLSPHFSFAEMTRTDNRRFLDENRQPPAHLLPAGVALCETLLEPIRAHFGQPVVIHSGYRCPALNHAIGGALSSQHLKFEAADFHVSGVALVDVWTWVWRHSGLPFGQLILEGWGGGRPGWIHLSLGEGYRDEDRCLEVLTMSGGRYTRVA
jgi:zinc D-Ala-D-Ala carboxypeptidase